MIGLSSDQIKRIRAVLETCMPRKNESLEALFLDQRIIPWTGYIPVQSSNMNELVNNLLLLFNRSSIDGENALVLLLEVIADSHDPRDGCSMELRKVASGLRHALGMGPPPPPRVGDVASLSPIPSPMKGDTRAPVEDKRPERALKPVVLEAAAGALRLSLVGVPDKWMLEAENKGEALLRMVSVMLRPPTTVAVTPNRVDMGSIGAATHTQASSEVVIRPKKKDASLEVVELAFEAVYRTPAGPERYKGVFTIPV